MRVVRTHRAALLVDHCIVLYTLRCFAWPPSPFVRTTEPLLVSQSLPSFSLSLSLSLSLCVCLVGWLTGFLQRRTVAFTRLRGGLLLCERRRG